ncbi:SLATT domain-containing protein [Paraclostridium bifermentans]|uniref:SLATT domain-containing protein n=1 Tax=Paraclostridium bifermentans TaxID=1490 RepID=UPI0011DCA887|nr:SLATT domain-containing protein [Paraclostridium bifermentans]
MLIISEECITAEERLTKEKVVSLKGQSESKEYDSKKWKSIMDTTQSNYANMTKRLTRKSKVSNFILIYYSIFLIINTLTGKYFPNNYNLILAEYFSIILSVIILAYSIINNNANYNIRINSIEDSLNEIKNLKRKLDGEKSLDKYVDAYNNITDKTERRDDIDFFHTVKQLAKLYNVSIITKKLKKGCSCDEEKVSVVTGYLSEISITLEISKMILEYVWYLIVTIIPAIVFLLCILKK